MCNMIQSSVNREQYSKRQYYLLDAVKAVSHAENCGGMGLEKVMRMLESP